MKRRFETVDGVLNREDFQHLSEDDPWSYNMYLNKWEQQQGKIVLDSYPLDLSLPFIEYCNAKCLFCSYWGSEPRCMTSGDIEKYRTIFKYLAFVGINPAGEPLLHPEFDKLLKMIKAMIDPRCIFYLVSNGSLLHQKQQIIMDTIDSLTISLNAATPDTHAEVMGMFGQFSRIINSLEEIERERKRKNTTVKLYATFVVLRQNLHEIPGFIQLCEKIGLDRIYFRNLATANVNNPIKPGKNPKYYSLQPRLHPDFKRLRDEAVIAIRTSSIEIVAEPEKWVEDIYIADHQPENLSQLTKNLVSSTDGDEKSSMADGWVAIPGQVFPLSCQYLYKYMIDPRQSDIQPVCVYMESLPGFDAVHLDLSYFQKVRNAPAMTALRKSLRDGPKLPNVCIRCNILSAFKHSDL